MLFQSEYWVITSLKNTFHALCQNVQLITNDEMTVK